MSLFLNLAIDTVARALSLTDRDPASPTYGCVDRNYWHYRIIDVSNARFQEAGLLFALAYLTDSPDNPFFGKEKMKIWARQCWHFWLEDRNRDGSVSEVYPNERSFCATSFTTAAFVETVRLLGGAQDWQTELEAARPTLLWLGKNANPEVVNQIAASWLALEGYAQLTQDGEITTLSMARRDQVLAWQSQDGTLPEYGGLDVGYQTITLSVLASLLQICPDDTELAACLDKGLDVIKDKIAADGSVDISANSRNTQYIYPHAFAARNNPLLDAVTTGLEKRTVLRPTWMDDRYCHALAADYLLTYGLTKC